MKPSRVDPFAESAARVAAAGGEGGGDNSGEGGGGNDRHAIVYFSAPTDNPATRRAFELARERGSRAFVALLPDAD